MCWSPLFSWFWQIVDKNKGTRHFNPNLHIKFLTFQTKTLKQIFGSFQTMNRDTLNQNFLFNRPFRSMFFYNYSWFHGVNIFYYDNFNKYFFSTLWYSKCIKFGHFRKIGTRYFNFLYQADFPKYVGPTDMSDNLLLGLTIFYSESVWLSGFYPSGISKGAKPGKKQKSTLEERAEQQ
jgi:hypothetical protein